MTDPRSSKPRLVWGFEAPKTRPQNCEHDVDGPAKKSRPAGQPPASRRRTLPLTAPRGRCLGNAARQEPTDRDLIVKPHRTNDRASCPVRFGDHGIVGNVDPVVLDATPI